MPGCAAIGCNNRSEKGYMMKCFPRDPALRTIWKQKVGRADWEPSNNSFLCHDHFEHNQWITTKAGVVKLKKNAIPTIFTITSKRKSPTKKQKIGLPEPGAKIEMNEFEIEYLDSSNPVFLNLANNKKTNIINVQSQNSELTGQILQNISILSSDALKNLQNENIIIVSDENNREIGKIVTDNAMVDGTRNKENVLNTEMSIKEEVIQENGSFSLKHEALEKKLKLIDELQGICHESESDSSNDACLVSLDDRSVETENDSENALNNEADKRPAILCKKRCSTTSKKAVAAKKCTKPPIKKSRKSPIRTMNKSTSEITIDLESDNSNACDDVVPAKRIKMGDASKSLPKANRIVASKPVMKNDVLSKNAILLLPVNSFEKANTSNFKVQKDVNSVKKKTKEEELSAKVEAQADVIEKLSSQLFMHKDEQSLIRQLKQKLSEREKEVEELKELQNQSAAEKLLEKKVKFDAKKLRSLSRPDLIAKVSELEEQVKTLMKAMNEEVKLRKQLECKLKGKETNIKDLNWKLEKASKFLERSERNMINYKNKMRGLQTLLKKQNVLNYRTTVFDDLFVCNASKDFTEYALKQARDIKEACGTDGYEKLLACKFPLPSLKFLNKNEIKNDSYENENEDDSREYKWSEIAAEEEVVEYLDPEFVDKPNKTVVKTVQDIFYDESSDAEDLSELKIHLMRVADFDENEDVEKDDS